MINQFYFKIQFRTSHLFALSLNVKVYSLNVKQFSLTHK